MCAMRDTFLRAVAASSGMPEPVRAQAHAAVEVEAHSFDRSYIEFLDEQVRLSHGGPSWIERLRRRREGLEPFCGRTLLRGRIHIGNEDFTVEVDPEKSTVVYWERYDEMPEST